ncbi:LIM domain-binding protein 3 isoform X2 [Toxorhynchites rutilus septentrionalis]|uniref:LIM domain-binding protein 3 isoform X2 n=1 Tax=Toxorhynchites rutilus septentrionalis TaxID=329112 RepID=UPI0024789BDA|nr:LIM domain-binding protein 3 isoform X2 [Toxorhynchites rutilus septentrionalis]
MVLDIAIARYDNTTPFGFKLVGGADFDVPLQVVKIIPGSIAEEVGMHIGDVVVRINDIPTNNLSYYDAHQLLACAGNRFLLGILRAREVPPQQRAVKEPTPTGEVEYINTSPKPFWTPNTNITQSREEQEIEEKISDVPITDEQIAEILSGEAEVLKQHNVLGVNFKKMIPTSEVFKQSEVFKTLNSELIQTEEEKKWTTFLKKPSRPAPKTREEKLRDMHPPTERYQVRIVKQPKPKIAPDYKPPKSPEPEPEPEPVPLYEEYLHERAEIEEETTRTLEAEPVMENPDDAVNQAVEPEEEEPEASEEFRSQLENVQKQLEALSSLPNTIQATIAALTEQLSALAQPKRKSKSVTPRPKEGFAANAEQATAEVSSASQIVAEVSETFEVTEHSKTEAEPSVREQSASSDEGEHITYTDEQLEKLQLKMKEHDIEWTDRNDKSSEDSSQTDVSQGGTRTAIQNELKMQVVKKKKKAVSAFGPLTPQERPIFLPGGRKWRNAKDAFNEQFIAEVISSQAELIQGTTLGVNFLKYQKPEKDLSFIKNSDVYKLIHDKDPPKTGIELRPELVLAEEDVRKVMHDETIFQPRKSKVFLYQN